MNSTSQTKTDFVPMTFCIRVTACTGTIWKNAKIKFVLFICLIEKNIVSERFLGPLPVRIWNKLYSMVWAHLRLYFNIYRLSGELTQIHKIKQVHTVLIHPKCISDYIITKYWIYKKQITNIIHYTSEVAWIFLWFLYYYYTYRYISYTSILLCTQKRIFNEF